MLSLCAKKCFVFMGIGAFWARNGAKVLYLSLLPLLLATKIRFKGELRIRESCQRRQFSFQTDRSLSEEFLIKIS
jgi:hypothetical protein